MKLYKAILILVALSSIGGCKKENNFLLSPARKLSGTWESVSPITLSYVSDECGGLWELGKTEFQVTWIISKKKKNEVDITMKVVEVGNYQDYGYCSFWYTAFFDSEEYYTGTISSSEMVIYDLYGDAVGEFSFTSDIMSGTFSDVHCSLFFCTGWASATNGFKLVRTD